MKIIKEGKLPEVETIRVTCRNCNCVFEFLVGEAKKTFDQRDGDYYTIACPTVGCSKMVIKSAK